MTKIFCDKCGVLIADNNALFGRVVHVPLSIDEEDDSVISIEFTKWVEIGERGFIDFLCSNFGDDECPIIHAR